MGYYGKRYVKDANFTSDELKDNKFKKCVIKKKSELDLLSKWIEKQIVKV